MKKAHRFLVALIAMLMFAATACTSDSTGVSQDDYDQVQADLAAAQQTITDLEGQIGATAAPTVIVQTVAGDPSAAPAAEGWNTPASIEAKIELLATYDTSGDPDAWDPAAHPNVFITSEGHGYQGFISETYTQAGFQIIDAVTKEHVYSAAFDLGFDSHGTPHSLGVSMDGRYIYIPTSDGGNAFRPSTPNGGRLLVVDARTGTLAQVIGTGCCGPHHVKAFIDFEGNSRVLVETQGGPTMLLDPLDANRVVATFGPDDLYGQLYQVDVNPAGTDLYFDLSFGGRGNAPNANGAVARVSLVDGSITYINGVGNYPNGFAFTADGKYTYVADSITGSVSKIDNETNKVVGQTISAVPGPYEIALNLDETELWVVGKGEMTFNRGGTLGLVDTKSFRAVNQFDIGGQTIDHDTMNPWAPNEMWVTSSGTANTIVLDMPTRTVIDRIPDANGGDTHSGSFVEYNADFTGNVLNDLTGPKGWFLEQVAAAAAAAAAA